MLMAGMLMGVAADGLTYLNEVLSDSPSHLWLFDEGSGTLASDHISSLDLTHNNSPNVSSSPIINDSGFSVSYASASSQYSSGSSTTTLSFPFSLECAFNISTLTTESGLIHTHALTTGAFRGAWISIDTSGRVVFAMGDGTGEVVPNDIRLYRSASVISSGVNYHIVVSATSITSVNLYLNGASVPIPLVTGTATTMHTSSGSIRVGGYVASSVAYSDATIDVPCVYNGVALTLSRASAHYNASGI
jgi:hypothetical protein